ncbi:MAG: hypothetical protein R3309_09275 [Reinekea sp.]|nr:hypothetical protein [Reinekea sp.]
MQRDFGHYPIKRSKKFIQSFESWGDTMKKNSSFVNLFLEESASYIEWETHKCRMRCSGFVVFQATMNHYSESEGALINHFMVVDNYRLEARQNRLIGRQSYFTVALRL